MTDTVVVDLGNSVAKIARVDERSIVSQAGVPTAALRGVRTGADLLAASRDLEPVLAGRPDVVLGSVVSWAGARLAAALTGFGCRVRPVTSLDFTRLGVFTQYQYGEPGVDRVAASAEAFARSEQAVIVVGLGTAVHTNVVTDAGVYMGGAIMPGLRLMSESLGVGTDQLGIVSPRKPKRTIGDSTPEGVEIGLYHAWVGGTLRLIEETRREFGLERAGRPAIWLTGGHSEWIAEQIPDARVDADLSVLGLARLSEKLR